MPVAAADSAATARARARLEAARAAEDANPTKANRLAVDRALAEFNAASSSAVSSSSTFRRITAAASIAESEPNDTSGTADALSFGANPGATATAAISPAGDVDFFSFTAPANARLWGYVDTGGAQNVGANSRDSFLQFIGSDGTTVLEADDDDGSGNGLDGTQETGLASSIAYLAGPPAGGTVYARINAVDALPLDQVIDPMTLYVVATTTETAEVEGNDTFGTANVLYNGIPHVGVRTGTLTAAVPEPPTPADQDFYSISASAGDILYLALDNNPLRDASSVDFELELLSTDGTTILFTANSDSDDPLSEAFAFQVGAAGTFYVRVFDNGGNQAGPYAVMVANMTQSVPVELQRFEVD
jgi:hypothetical protein